MILNISTKSFWQHFLVFQTFLESQTKKRLYEQEIERLKKIRKQCEQQEIERLKRIEEERHVNTSGFTYDEMKFTLLPYFYSGYHSSTNDIVKRATDFLKEKGRYSDNYVTRMETMRQIYAEMYGMFLPYNKSQPPVPIKKPIKK